MYVRSNQKDSGGVPYLLNVGSGALFYMPTNDEFEKKYSLMTNTPYVFMQPPCDMPESHDIIGAILEHRIAILKGWSPYVFMQPPCNMAESHDLIRAILENRIAILKGRTAKELPTFEKFCNLWVHRDTWTWPRTSDRSHHSLPACLALYSLSTEDKYKTHASLWEYFIHALSEDGTPATSGQERLGVFKEMSDKATKEMTEKTAEGVPRIARPTPMSNHSHGEKTWREILLGKGGQWKQAIESKKAYTDCL